MEALLFDLESNGLLDALTRIHCIVTKDFNTGEVRRYNNQPETGAGSIEEGVEALSQAPLIVGHNALSFDAPAITKLFPEFRPVDILDTLVCSRVIWAHMMEVDSTKFAKRVPRNLWGRHKLEAWGYRLGCHKGDFGKTTDWAEWSQPMEDYCAQDVEVTFLLFKKILEQSYSQECLTLEHQFRALMDRQERHGFGFRVEDAKRLYGELSRKRFELQQHLQSVFPPKRITMKKPEYYYWAGSESQFPTKGQAEKAFRTSRGKRPKPGDILPGPIRVKEIPFNPASGEQIADRLTQKYGWQPQEFTPSGRPQVTEVTLESLKFPECKELCEFLTLNKRIGQLAEGKQAWLKLERNGKIYGSINTNGAVTGRCTHASPNVAQTPAVYSPFGKECRSLFVPPTLGFKLVGWDASGLELRCLAHFMARWDGGAYAKVLLESDIHTANQEAAGLPTRDQAKTFIYAFLYGAGDEKIGSIVERGPKEGRRLKERFLRSLPALRRLKESLDATVRSRGFLFGLDGRKLHIRSSHAALNTLLQSAGAVVMKKAAVLQYHGLINSGLKWGSDFAYVANVHDELQIEARPEVAEQVGQAGVSAIREAGKHFRFRCPLDGAYKVGNSWAETH